MVCLPPKGSALGGSGIRSAQEPKLPLSFSRPPFATFPLTKHEYEAIFGLLSARSIQPWGSTRVLITLKKGHVHAQHGQVGSKIPSIGWILPREPKMITEATAVTAKTPPDALAATSKAK